MSAMTRKAICAAIAFVSCLSTLGGVRASGLGATNQAPAAKASYIPEYAALFNMNAQRGGKVCVIGYSQQKTGVKIGTYDPFDIPAYYLKQSGVGHHPGAAVWELATSNTSGNVAALEVGGEVTNLALKPIGPPAPAGNYINAGTLTFFFIKSPPKDFLCSSITFSFADKTTGAVNTPYYPFPRSLFEVSTYPLWDAASKTYTNVATVDTSNVDSFEAPLAVNVLSRVGSKVARIASFGNPVASPLISRRSAISGPQDTGGASSPFYRWLQIQPAFRTVAAPFLALALGTPKYPYALIDSATDYLSQRCTKNPVTGLFVPAGCTLNNQFVNLRDPLNSYFDAELDRFFKNVVHNDGKTTTKLTVMGDASGTYASEPWSYQSHTSCPLYLRPDGQSLQFKTPTQAADIVLCNPLNQVQFLEGAPTKVDLALAHDQKDPKITWVNATFHVTAAQCAAAQKRPRWNLGQPETGFVALITNADCTKNQLTGMVVSPPPANAKAGTTKQSYCRVLTGCSAPNLSFRNWLFSNIPWVPGVNWSESPSQMVFANDGAFAAWQAVLYAKESDRQIVAASIARNIVAAFSRGVANCNNVTMAAPLLKPSYCSKVTALGPTEILANARSASDAYWSKESNFYPAGGYQNYYSQYLHTMQLGASPATNIFAPPTPIISGRALSNQGVLMGMAYGFGYDENPSYLTTPNVPMVPSKLDPIPSSWQPSGGSLDLQVIVGNSD